MSSRDNRFLKELIPMSVVQLLGRVEEFKGRQQLYYQQSSQILESLQQIAMVQSTESSNRIEGIEVPSRKLHAMMADKVKPANRSEGEVAGYRDVLATIHASYPHIPVTPNTILQLHRDLYKFVTSEGGRWTTLSMMFYPMELISFASDRYLQQPRPGRSRNYVPVSGGIQRRKIWRLCCLYLHLSWIFCAFILSAMVMVEWPGC